MTIIAERGLFVRLLVQSGKFAPPDAETLADALDAATREPATKADLQLVENRLSQDIALLRGEVNALRVDVLLRLEAHGDRLTVRMGGTGLTIAGLLFAALRLT